MSTPNIFSIERSTGVVTASENPLLVYNDVVPISIAFTDSGVVSTTLIPFRAALAVNLRLGTASGMMLAQAVQFDTSAGYSAAILKLPPEVQDRLYLSDGVVWLEFVLSEKTGPSSRHTVESLIDLAASGAPVDLNNAALTGISTADAINPNVADLGTVASGTITLSTTKAANKVVVTGSAATIALPATPIALNHVLLVQTVASVVTFTVPSLTRDDGDGVTAVTSVQFAANANGALVFRASGVAFVAFWAPGSIVSIASSSLAGFSTGDVAEGSTVKFTSQSAVVAYVNDRLGGFSPSYASVTGLTPGTFMTRGTAGEGVAELGTFGSGLSFNPTTKVLSATATGSTAPYVFTGSDINFENGTRQQTTLTGATTFTFSNIIDGQVLHLFLSAVGAGVTPAWPASVDFGAAGAPTIADGENAHVMLTVWGTAISAVALVNSMEFDVSPPLYVSSSIPSAGTTLVDTYNETLSATIAATTGRAITMSGGAATPSSPVVSGATVTWTLSRTVEAGETCSANSYTAPGTGIKDSAGNYAGSYTGRQADVTNSSTASSYLINEDFSGTGTPSGWTSASGTPDFDKVVTTALGTGTGRQCLEVNTSAEAAYAAFTAQDDVYYSFNFRAEVGSGTLPLQLKNGGTAMAWFQLMGTGPYDMRIYANGAGGGYSTISGVTYTPDTQIFVWGAWTNDNGTNSNHKVWWNTTNSYPGDGSFVGQRNSTITATQVNRAYVAPGQTTPNYTRIADVKISATKFF